MSKISGGLSATIKLLVSPGKVTAFLNGKMRSALAKLRNLNWSDQDFILHNIEAADASFLNANNSAREVEHQVGRFVNMKLVCREITDGNIAGDILEFGTWQGTGLLLLSRCFPKGETTRSYIGIDSFEGLPESSTIWRKGEFSDTSLEITKNNVAKKIGGKPFHLIKGWFNAPEVAIDLYKATTNVALVHFDADLGSSTAMALNLVEPFLVGRKQPIYFLFDDWGNHPDEVPDAFYGWMEKAASKFNLKAEKVGSTRCTRYYRIIFA